MAKGFVKGLVGDDFLKFKITPVELEYNKDCKLQEEDKLKFLTLIARNEATSLAKVKEKITIDFIKIGQQDATERQRDANNTKIKRMVSKFKKETDIILSWEDADGDEMVVGTDEHLAIALDEMPGPIYKFKVRIIPEDSDDEDDSD